MKIETIKTKRLVLRPYRMSDAEIATKNLCNKKISRWLSSLPSPYRIEDANNWIGKMIEERKKKEPQTIAYVIEYEKKMIGAIGLHGIVFGHKAELGYWLSEEFWGKGVMSEAVTALVSYAFRRLRLRRIQAGTFVGNSGSEGVLKKCGFQHEGLIRNDVKKNNRFVDCNIFSRIK
ncbi:MAG: N-acetyltransferase GCN5 [Candidatus Falkowbacteria bacterium GW2011_GWC2_38_22]|uniref:N-acetyltransferase GCN5 n=1 Tax=Candidatus Falkowbacteria bacterium GW2011_GWE1_38_31 TaxID=1618638 RepID=A0A0G0JUN3_9BACT|nr:MAG: N-acetyltransferase GCN5 [Candidatus Falkowbacteria bacterium GW2011_GWF2_38_1205]KKQ61819.1 MAG: N-acetyltransferase GCN5 [Candidatus Falkowbacteria bacterium GW2011_GWC2_38_22]KKQ64127.1 MAG: N-acetyltransferase GCN5 [Candidatus Falkowbacteria bacterium GW2011_GWF1_38_22]KKQ66523.1 MAG: N-acetyltransferase GCN5 [Candidatus Falkowbacteria bacterium GW2011_GWE2_38_254]KKQ71233.1 MAG: N-acetyltransferase GCN5 [Candidatus Falkowbacteria bacterium GW2011_GWE1_38_31]KKQ73361.1 MAG: N-acety